MNKKFTMILVATMLVAGTIVGCAPKEEAPKAPVETTTDAETPVEAETPAEAEAPVASKYDAYANTDILVSPEKAAELIEGDQKVVIFDIRKSTDYLLGHIPESQGLFRTDYESTDFEYGGMAMERDQMAELLGKAGLESDSLALIYGDSEELDGARFAWILDMYGHENIAIVDGGYDAWKKAGFSTTMSKPSVEATTYTFPREMDASLIATLDEVKAAVESQDPNVIILDTRSDAEFNGEEQKKGAFNKGRIPGSVHIEYKKSIGEDGFKTADELRTLFEDAGVTADKTIISYCQSGVRSAHTTFVLKELLGYEDVKNYDGSWIEWSFNSDLPIE